MKALKTLIIGAVVGAVLAVSGLAALAQAVNPSATEVAKKVNSQTNSTQDTTLQPPTFYGSR
jgi:hypothetical protein